jgi:hypothetical protein
MGEATETAVSRRLNWERANLNKKAKLSLSDEREFMERDRAARWLEHQEQRRQAKLMKAPQTPSIATKRQPSSNTRLPWEGESEFDEGQSKSRDGGNARKHRR